MTLSHLKQQGKSTGTFHFKRFSVADSQSTMKVGTDAVLLGAAADVAGTGQILEIGTGCGVIALMLAQRSDAHIDAIEIDEESVRQSRENVMQSPWHDRIKIIHRSLQDYVRLSNKNYDLVISNPPFFSRSLKSDNEKRNISRHDEMLSFEELIRCALYLMSHKASFWVILPVKESVEFINIAVGSGLFVRTSMQIIPKPGKASHRVILELKKSPAERISERVLVIRDEYGNYTKDYVELTGEFYLDFFNNI
jgi:tRNA1Val (adenine37-N6)-methyltransferase